MKKTAKITAALLAAAIGVLSSGITAFCDSEVSQGTGSAVTANLSSNIYSVEKGDSKVFSLKISGAKQIAAVSSDKSVIKITGLSYKNGKVKIKVKGVSEGTAVIKIYDKKNTKNSKSFNIQVSDPYSYTYVIVYSNGQYYLVEYSGDTSQSSVTAPTENSTEKTSSDYANEVLTLVNKERTSRGLTELKLNESMCEAANTRARELSKVFDHTRPDGSSCFTVLDEYNISYYTAGENIAYGYTTAEGVMNGWMNSAGHKGNILSSSFTEIGIGYDPETNSWVQLFKG